MKRNLIIVLLLITSANCFAQSKNPLYDAQLAKKLGADQYGMKTYIMTFLKAGPNRSKDSVARAELLKAHLKNITRLADEGKLILAGPFMDDQPIKGIYIFNVTTIEEAKKLTETDPAIQTGSLVMELHLWYGSAALMETVGIHKTLWKDSFSD
jgi:uncharacterized protein YciI